MPETLSRWFENPSRWRLRYAEMIARRIDGAAMGVEAVYLIGSVKNHTAGPGSDVDLLIHVRGTQAQQETLVTWLRGWGESMAGINEALTGLPSDNLLDIHLVTDEDIRRKTSYAVMIGSLYDRAKPLKMR